MFERSLMERLEQVRASGDSSQQQGSFDCFRASVLENLSRVLNAHQGCCETRPDLGMPDLTNAIGQGADAVRAVAHSLTQQIEMFEPRLRNVSIRFQTDCRNPLQLTFHVSAMPNYSGCTEPITFAAIYEERVRVKG